MQGKFDGRAHIRLHILWRIHTYFIVIKFCLFDIFFWHERKFITLSQTILLLLLFLSFLNNQSADDREKKHRSNANSCAPSSHKHGAQIFGFKKYFLSRRNIYTFVFACVCACSSHQDCRYIYRQ